MKETDNPACTATTTHRGRTNLLKQQYNSTAPGRHLAWPQGTRDTRTPSGIFHHEKHVGHLSLKWPDCSDVPGPQINPTSMACQRPQLLQFSLCKVPFWKLLKEAIVRRLKAWDTGGRGVGKGISRVSFQILRKLREQEEEREGMFLEVI